MNEKSGCNYFVSCLISNKGMATEGILYSEDRNSMEKMRYRSVELSVWTRKNTLHYKSNISKSS